MSVYSVQLYCYDLSNGMAANLSPLLLGRRLEGIWHTAIIVYGKEFYFDGGTGIVYELPGRTRFGQPRRIEQLGTTTKTEGEFIAWTQEQRRSGFGPNDYSLLLRNCNHFTQVAAQFLLQRDIPSDISNMIPMVLETPLGSMLRPILEQMTTAPAIPEGSTQHQSGGISSGSLGLDTATVTQPSCTTLLSTKDAFTQEEEEDILIAWGMLQSNEYLSSGTREGFALTMGALELLRSALVNIIEHPSEVKFRGISTSSQSYTAKLLPLEKFGVVEVLRLAGFRLRQHPSGTGQQWFLSDTDGSVDILSILVTHLNDMIDVIKAEEPVEPPPAQTPPPDTHTILQYFTLPVPKGFKPLLVGYENGNRIFACAVTVKGVLYLGKCALDIDDNHVAAYYCSLEGNEVVASQYTVLCVRDGCEDEVVWLSAADVFDVKKMNPENAKLALFRVGGQYNVIRAPIGASVHAGFAELSGCCIVPYGGLAKNCNSTAQVLCLRAHVPPAFMEESLQIEESECLISDFNRDAGVPIHCLRDLLAWSASKGGPIIPAVECRKRVNETSAKDTRLLVCHDMRGGYLPGDYPHFALCVNTGKEEIVEVDKVVDLTYTVSYWSLIKYFVYFSHRFISIPPKEWINAAHRNGVPALGTFITEGVSSDLCELVESPQKMSNVIGKLLHLCDTYNFDGYLINIESNLDELLAQRLVMFINMLRQTLNKKIKPGSTERIVIWYDAITIDGKGRWQNGLTAKNKPFFDVSNGIFTNYFWNPINVQLSKVLGADRANDVYIGVDVFGRNMYGGGGYNSGIAAEVAKNSNLSVALFAPGWTCEVEGQQKREKFLQADSILWSRLQKFFHRSYIEFDQPLLWTCFRSGVGKQYYVNGEQVVAPVGGAEWCQLSHSHLEPDFRYTEEVDSDANLSITLPLESGSGQSVNTVSATWTSDTVWMGDRSLSFVIPPGSTVRLVKWRARLNASTNGSDDSEALGAIDIAWLCDASKPPIASRQVCICGISAESPARPTQLTFDEGNILEGLVRVVSKNGAWEIVRYTIPARVRWSHVTSIAVQNGSKENFAPMTVGAIGFSRHCVDGTSILTAGQQCRLSDDAFKVRRTRCSTLRLTQIKLLDEPTGKDVILFARVTVKDTTSVIYMGQHAAAPSIAVPIHLPTAAVVKDLFMYRVMTDS